MAADRTADQESLDWLEVQPEVRLEDVRWRVINERCSVREAIEWFRALDARREGM